MREFLSRAVIACAVAGLALVALPGGLRNTASLPDGAPVDSEGLAGAYRETSVTRTSICLNGLWRCRPALANDAPDFVPGDDDAWGWGVVPKMWHDRVGVLQPDFRPAISLSPWFAQHPEEKRGILPLRAWYARSLIIPEEAKGRCVRLRFMMVNTRVVVYVDGRRAGEVCFPCGEVDLTDFVRPGERQTVELDVTAYSRNRKTLEFNAPDRAKLTVSQVNNPGLTGDVFLDLLPRGPRLGSCWTECDVASKRVVFVAEAENGFPRDAKLSVMAALPTGEGFKSFVGTPIRDASGTWRLEASWPDVRLWDVHTPQNLYVCRLAVLASDGTVMDETTPFRFGFRDVKLRGRDLLLNGVPIHLRALDNNKSMYCGPSQAGKRTVRAFCRRAQKAGFNMFIVGNYHFHEGAVSYMDGLLESCDETGMLMSFALPHVRDFDFALDDPKVADSYRALMRKVLRLMRNHPSVIAYAMNHNCTGYRGDQNPMRIDGKWYDDVGTRDEIGMARNRANARWAAEMVRELDSTRTVYHHESGNLGDWYTLNCYLNWAPRQERSDWLEHWSTEGVKPLFLVEWGLPHLASWSSYRGPDYIWRTKALMNTWAAEYAAACLGDAAYEDSEAYRRLLAKDSSLWQKGQPFRFPADSVRDVTNLYHGVQAWYASDNWRAMRTWGATALLPWDQGGFFVKVAKRAKRNSRYYEELKQPGMAEPMLPNDDAEELGSPTAIGREMLRWNQDDLAYIGGPEGRLTDKRHHYTVLEPIRKSLVICNDRRVPQRIRWAVRCAGQRSDGVVDVEPGGQARVPIEFFIDRSGQYDLEAACGFADGQSQKDSFTIEVVKLPQEVEGLSPVLLWDPIGLTAENFRRLGVEFDLLDRPLLSSTEVSGRIRLVIGRNALSNRLFDDLVLPFAQRGGRVLLFEQDKQSLESIGFRVQEYGLRQVFPRGFDGGLSDFSEASFRDWAGASTLIPPSFTNAPLLEKDYPRSSWAGFVNSRVWRCGNRGAVATVLPEKPTTGDWLPLVDGGFDLQYAPLLAWRVGTGEVLFCQLDVTGRTENDPVSDNLTKRLLTRMNTSLPCAPDVTDDFVVTSGTWAAANRIIERVKNGGRCFAVGLCADEVRAICPVAPAVVQTNGCFFSRIEKIPQELAGLSNADWAWRDSLSFAAFEGEVLDGNNAFRVVRYGAGKFVFMQVAPWMIDDEKKPYLRTSRRHAEFAFSRIKGNLGIRSDMTRVTYADVPKPDDDPYRYIRW